MTYPLGALPARGADPPGASYAAVLARAAAPEAVRAVLREVRFSGWLVPPDDGWLVAVCGSGTVAAGRRGVVEVGAALAGRLPGTVLAVRVLGDRQLALVGWEGGAEIGRYVSDPSYGAGDDVLPDPLGAEHATAFAAACGRPEVAGDLAVLLGAELDPDSVNESERLASAAELLGLPAWLVAVGSLPRDVPTGPRAAELTRLGAGMPGAAGRLRGALAGRVRRRRPPPPVVADPPRGAGPDPWFL